MRTAWLGVALVVVGCGSRSDLNLVFVAGHATDAGVDATRAPDATVDAVVDGAAVDATGDVLATDAADADAGVDAQTCPTVPTTCLHGCFVLAESGDCGWIYSLTIDRANLYWVTEASSNRVMKAPLAGGTPQVLVAFPSTASIHATLVDDSAFYVAVEIVGDAQTPDDLFRVPLDGGAPDLLYADPEYILPFASDGTTLYWGDIAWDQLGNSSGQLIRSMPRAGGAVTTLVSGPGAAATGLGGPGVLVDNTSIYWYWANESPRGFPALMRAPLDGGVDGAVASIVPVTSGPSSFTVAGARIYWTLYDGFNGQVLSAPLDGGTVTTLVTTGRVEPLDIVTDGVTLYWASLGFTTTTDGGFGAIGELLSMPVTGGTVTTLASVAGGEAAGIAVDATYVYFVGGAGNQILRTPK